MKSNVHIVQFCIFKFPYKSSTSIDLYEYCMSDVTLHRRKFSVFLRSLHCVRPVRNQYVNNIYMYSR